MLKEPIRQESEDDFESTLEILWFLIGCLNPVVLLVVLVTVAAGQKKLRGRWLINFGSLVVITTEWFFNSVHSYFTPLLEITDFMRGNMLKLMHGAIADDVVDLVLNRAGTWFCAQLPLGVPVGLIIAGVLIWRRSAGRDENNA